FEPGVTVVVGPNGSGKSNLVDAVAWVMGTQATTSLRTQQMSDVIFAGTVMRPALGRAEVSITLDNADGKLPLDLADVTITRRLYRDGTSEYAINGTTCRLLDIQELLNDGGIGRHQHVLVGQGRVDAVLNAGPDEHRAVIEEAAGVTKHRQRRDRSIRRLEATDLDVLRLGDLLGEQHKRMRPLKRQANAALRYDGVKAEWLALRLWLGGEALRTTGGRIETVAAEEAALRAALAADETGLAAAVERLTVLHRDAGETGRSLDRDTAAAARLETAAERLAGTARVARERRVALTNRLEGTGERRSDLVTEADDLRARITRTVVEEREARVVADRQEIALRSLEDEERSLAEQDGLPAEGVVATLRGDLAALEAAERRDSREVESTEQRKAVVDAKIAEDEVEAARLKGEIQRADASLDPARERYDATAADRSAVQAGLDAADTEVAESRVAVASAAARLEALTAAAAGAADQAAADHAVSLEAVIGPVVPLLDVPESLAAAVDAALGVWSTAFAVSDPDRVDEVIASLKAAGHGGITVVGGAPAVADRTPGSSRLVDRLGPRADRALAEALLGDVAVASDWSEAREIARRDPGLRVVTVDGDLVTSAGVRIAHPEDAGIVAVEAAGVAVERSEIRLARAISRQTAARRAFESARVVERDALEAVETVETVIAGAAEALRLIERAAAEARAEASRLADRRSALDEAAGARSERLAGMRIRLGAFEGEEAARQTAWEQLARRKAEVAERRETARRTREAAAGALAAIEERRTMLERRLEQVTGAIADLDTHPADPGDLDRLIAVEELAKRAVASARGHIDFLRERQRTLRAEAGDVGAGIEAAESAREEIALRITETRAKLSALAVEAAELAVRLENAAEALRRDADTDEETALGAPRPEIPENTTETVHLESLGAQLRRMGPINPLAAAEYQELEERAGFLEAQLEDLESSRRELRKVIAMLDQEIGRLFAGAFEEIAEKFAENFSLLFPGGTGRMSLTDPDDPLITGVDIHAQPMGKKVGKLGLLSGGERSLAALAFLFAVFRARPSPFYVLDEVEAALDDANLRRFLRLVATMQDTAQLVIVTHQQQTMEAADILYGVTMEPGESSRVLAKRIVPVRVPAQ
ncbi:chromosome segregation protein SMC, partial [bacterium]|nr:chromosome segregation protein SMC [bacterium]